MCMMVLLIQLKMLSFHKRYKLLQNMAWLTQWKTPATQLNKTVSRQLDLLKYGKKILPNTAEMIQWGAPMLKDVLEDVAGNTLWFTNILLYFQNYFLL